MTSEDHFVTFVDRLGADLDDIPSRAEDLAAQAHLSRFHFERVIAAVSGETPTRFRARVLMERAAYRMITTDATLLDLAVEAGYSSHEAFTRAFRREYGAAPSAWRRRPTRFQIDAPSGVHFHPPAGLRLPARERMDDMGLVTEMVDHHVWLVGELLDRADRLDAEVLDAPLAARVDLTDGDSLRWLLSRLVGQMAMWNAAVDNREYDFEVERDEPVASMRARLAVTGPEFKENIQRFSEEGRFDETFVDAHWPHPTVLSYGAMVAHVLTFAAHHRLLALDVLAAHGQGDLTYGDPKVWFDARLQG